MLSLYLYRMKNKIEANVCCKSLNYVWRGARGGCERWNLIHQMC